MNRIGTIVASLLPLLVLTACVGGRAPSLVGNWEADDGTGIKVVRSNGACSGLMYFGPGNPTDIGSGMSCSMSSKKDNDDRYSLVVSDSLQQVTLKVAFDGDDTARIYSSSGDLLLTMTRM